jgi:hypothetical protein
MGKSAGKPGEMRYTGITTDEKGRETGESYRDGKNREWVQKTGEGTPKKYAAGGSVSRGQGLARSKKTKSC